MIICFYEVYFFVCIIEIEINFIKNIGVCGKYSFCDFNNIF